MGISMNISVLADELGLEEEDVRDLVRLFLDSTEQDLERLAQAYASGDAELLRSTAHHVKGAAGNLEVNGVAAEALAMEQAAASGDLEDPAPRIDRIRTELEALHAQLEPNG